MSGNAFGELVLILGDLHIPNRATKIPAPFKRMLVRKMNHVICTGNIDDDSYEELRSLAPNVHVVAGQYDGETSNLVFPETRVVKIGAFSIGIVHGHQIVPYKSPEALARMRRKLNVDILVTGHTHQNEVSVQEGCYYFINPGSITGAYSPLCDNVTPSFVLLAVQDTKIVCYVYELGPNDQVDVSKTEFIKQQQESPSSAANPALLESLLK